MEIETYVFNGQSINCYGLEVVKRNFPDHEFCQYSKLTDNTAFISLYWIDQIYDLIKLKYLSSKNKRLIVGGNTATTNPAPLIALGCDVFLGDGENYKDLGDYTHIANEQNIGKDISVAEKIYPVKYDDIQKTGRSFVEISRGCENKCLFCQYGNLKSYREIDVNDIEGAIMQSNTKSIRIFAADRFQHSQFREIQKLSKKYHFNDTGSDVSLRFINKNPDYLNYTRKVRTGIEGMSYRLRKMVGKNYSDDEIVEFTLKIIGAGIKCIDWYMIYGLPTERKQDILDFQQLLKKIDKEVPRGTVIAIHWNAFTPSAQTPFQWEAPAFNYKHIKDMDDIIFSTHTQNVKWMHKPRLTSDYTILERMLAIRSSEKTMPILKTVSANKSLLKTHTTQIAQEASKRIGFNILGKIDMDTVMPWDKYVNYNSGRFRTVCKNHLEKYGN
jgi:radical SAM superfamily enzyme YgiQ (UPF0313 family)